MEERLPAWKDQLQDQLQEVVCSLAEIVILKLSFSLWSSAMVPVQRPDGSMRLGLNFKNINVVTTPDPYLMPWVHDMLTQICNAEFLMKMDLNKDSIRSHFGKKISAR